MKYARGQEQDRYGRERDAGLRSIHTRKYQAAPAAATKGCSSTSEKIGFRDFLPFSVCEFLFLRKNERRSFDEIFFFLLKRSFGNGYGSHGPHKKELFVQKACNQSRLKCSNPILNYIYIKQGVAEYISSRLCQSGQLSHNTFQSIRAQ